MDQHPYHHHHHHDQYQHPMTITKDNPYNTINTTQPPPTTMDSTSSTMMIMDEEKKMMMTTMTTRPQEPRNCPRCNSSNTKFCYYNNYSLAQPRYLCKSCRRYWTEGGSLRNVPVGGGSRKNKKLPLLLPNSSTPSSTKNLPDLNPPFVFKSSPSSSNPSKTHQNNNDLSLSFSSPMLQDKRAQGHYGHFSERVVMGGQNCLFPAPMGMIQFRQEHDHDDHENKTNLGFSLDGKEEENGNDHDNFVNGGGSKMMFPYGHHDDHHHHERHDDGDKKREGGSSNELWSGIILGGDSGGPTW